MDQKDINILIGKNKNTITIEGVREPTEHEDSTLRTQLRKKYGDIDSNAENQLLLKAGAGRFGKFSETYQLPDYVDTDGINAIYEGGILSVNIPKIRRHSRNPYAYPTSFANDRDFWW